jgi:hypothetical protein
MGAGEQNGTVINVLEASKFAIHLCLRWTSKELNAFDILLLVVIKNLSKCRVHLPWGVRASWLHSQWDVYIFGHRWQIAIYWYSSRLISLEVKAYCDCIGR